MATETRRRARPVVIVLASTITLFLAAGATALGPTASADAATVPGTGSPRPRVAFDPGDLTLTELQGRVEREPYATVFRQMHARTGSFLGSTPGDPAIVAQRNLSRAAKNLAFEYAIDRTVSGDTVAPFADSAARQATGDRVRDLLVVMYDRSRLAVPAPLGGFDRDINTSEEIINYATALDTMLGAGYDFGVDRTQIIDRLHRVTAELHRNYSDPATVGGVVDLNQNNHRSKSGAAMAIAAVVLADEVDANEARAWFDFGAREVDDILRFVMSTGDGGYAEGPYYYRYTMQNVLPYVAVWERFLGGSAWTTSQGLTIPAYHHDPVFERAQRWMIDTLLPDGTMAPIDDGNPGRSYYWGALPQSISSSVRAAAAARWPATPQPLETDGSIDLAVDSIVAFDDSFAVASPDWEPTQFYEEAGTAVLRSGFGSDDLVVLALAEHGTASEFGRDRTGRGRAPQSHEHPDPGSFMLSAAGERLVLDPGYLTFSTHGLVNQPQDHNIVLIDGLGPRDPLVASLQWLPDPFGPPPTDGESTMYDQIDSLGVDRVSIVSRYGTNPATVRRDLAMIDDRYVVVDDDVAVADGSVRDLAWQLHGNGGGTSGGTFAHTDAGGRWEIGRGRLDAGFATTASALSLTTRSDEHEVPYGQLRNHTALIASRSSATARTVQVLVPTPISSPPPTITDRSTTGLAALRVIDGPRQLDVYARDDSTPIVDGGVRTDGRALNVLRDEAGLNTVHATDATWIEIDGLRLAEQATRGTLAWHHDNESVELVATGSAPRVIDSPWTNVVHHACSSRRVGSWRLPRMLDGASRIVMSAALDAAPGASATRLRRGEVGSMVTIDGKACDATGDALSWRWELVSAPPGSAWRLDARDRARPRLFVDQPGPFRLRGRVIDAHGHASNPVEVLVLGGSASNDTVDDDLDGRIDALDPDRDGPEPGDAIIVRYDSLQAGTTTPLDGVHVTFTHGTGTRGAVSTIRAATSFVEGALLADLRRSGLTWSGRLVIVDTDRTPAVVDIDPASITVERIAERAWHLRAAGLDLVLVDGTSGPTR